jgi:hypothetical protein
VAVCSSQEQSLTSSVDSFFKYNESSAIEDDQYKRRATMDADINRLLLRFEQLMRETNREVINPHIQSLSVNDLRPVLEVVAQARAVYLKRLYEIAQAHKAKKTLPTDDEIVELEQLQRRFKALAEGSQSIEVAIQRGYLDIKE